MLKRSLIGLLSALLYLAAFGQPSPPDTVINLRQVTVTASREAVFAIGQPVTEVDSIDRLMMPSATLADLVSSMPSLHVKDYGSGTLATLSIRGTSANHTGLVWNGLPVSPPNIGYLDLSTIRGDFFDRIYVRYGGAGTLYGSGNIGGTIHLGNTPDFGTGTGRTRIGASGGSFGQVDGRASYTWSGKKLYSHSSTFIKKCNNNFPYENLTGETVKLEHARMDAFGAIQDLALRLPHEQVLSLSAWFQYSDRDIPPTLTESESQANQLDRSFRLTSGWKQVKEAYSLEARMAFFNDFTRYSDARYDIYSTISTRTALGQVESTWSLFRHSKLFAGAGYTHYLGDLSAYDQPHSEGALALFASFLQPVPSIGWEFVAHLRQEFFTPFDSPFLFGLSGQGAIAGPLSMQWSFSRNFRAPTMNERFWQPGGNLNLEPELSLNGEMTILFHQPVRNNVFDVRTTLFTSRVENWIMWVPGVSFWYVENIQEVWSRGAEITAEQHFYLGAIGVSASEWYSYTHSTNEKNLGANDASYQKQLIYIPLHQGGISLAASWKSFGIMLKNTVAGQVYTTRDNQSSLEPYDLLDATISKSFSTKRNNLLDVSLNLNNLFNKDYQVTPYRPMPGFNFLISLGFNFNHSNQQ